MPQSPNEREKRSVLSTLVQHIVKCCSEILWIIKCTFYSGDKCKKIRCQCANLITGPLPIAELPRLSPPLAPFCFPADLITLKWIRVHFHKESETHFEWHWFLWLCNKGLFYSLLSAHLHLHLILILQFPPGPHCRLTCDWHISFWDLLIETSVFNQQGERATDWRGNILFRTGMKIPISPLWWYKDIQMFEYIILLF